MEEDKFVFMVDFITLNNIDKKNDSLIEVAKIRNETIGKDVLFVLYDKDRVFECNYNMFTEIINNKWCAIIRKEEVERLKKNPRMFKFSVYHELGHFINGDIGREHEHITNSKELSRERNRIVTEENRVISMELDADRFAVKQVGKSNAISTIDQMIKRRRELDNSTTAIKELELRKKAIMKIKI